MGSPLGLTLANFFLAKTEKKIIGIASVNRLLCYVDHCIYYVDRIFAVFETTKSGFKFLDILNSQHKNIKFTVYDGSELMCFLDVQIKVKEYECDTWTWRKTTHSGLLLNFNALCPLKWKSDLILCLLYCAKAICSSKSIFKNDVIYLWQMFLSNGNSIWFFNKFLQRFLTVDNDSSGRDRSETNPVVYLSISCIEKETRHFVNQLAKLFHVKFDVKLSANYKTFQTGTYFKFTILTPLLLCSNVIHKFTCFCDSNLTCIGNST